MDTILTEGVHLFMTQLLQSVADDCKTCVTEYTAPAIDLFLRMSVQYASLNTESTDLTYTRKAVKIALRYTNLI